MKLKKIITKLNGNNIKIEALFQRGKKPAVVFLHGFGSTKEEYADIIHLPEFSDRTILAYDAPGCGQSTCSDYSRVTIEFLVSVAEQMANHLGIEKFHLAGHSMGGLTALKVAMANRARVLSFINIEGNLASEDCFFSRKIIEAKGKDCHQFLKEFKEGVAESGNVSSSFYSTNLATKTNPAVVEPIFRSLVAHTDEGNLIEQFLALEIPKMFVHGDRNKSLSYLADLSNAGVKVVEIPFSGHFPMYSNAFYLWQSIGDFIEKVDGGYDG